MVIGKADVSWTGSTVIVARTTELAEHLLADGELRCPLCNTVPAGRPGDTADSASCATATAHSDRATSPYPMLIVLIVMPAALQPRHADTTAVIGKALVHKSNGQGRRRIATVIDRPVSTVRRWLRRPVPGTPGTHLPRRLLALAPDTFTALRNTGYTLHHALSVLAAAAYWDRHRYALDDPPWTLIGLYTRGQLLTVPG